MDCSLNLARALSSAVDGSVARFLATRQALFGRLSAYFRALQASQPVYLSEETIVAVVYFHYLLGRISVKPKKQHVSLSQNNVTLLVVVSEYLRELREQGYCGQAPDEKPAQSLRFSFEPAPGCFCLNRRMYALCYQMRGLADVFLISKLVADVKAVAPEFTAQICWRSPLVDCAAFLEMFDERPLDVKRLQRDIAQTVLDPATFDSVMAELESRLPLLITKDHSVARKKLIKLFMNCLSAFTRPQRPRVLTLLNRMISKNVIFDSHVRPRNVLTGDSTAHFAQTFNANKLTLVVCTRLKSLTRYSLVYNWMHRLQDAEREIYCRKGVFEVAQFDQRGRPGATYRVFSTAEKPAATPASSSVSMSESDVGTVSSISETRVFTFNVADVIECREVELFSHNNSKAMLCVGNPKTAPSLQKCMPHAVVGCLQQSSTSAKLLSALISWVKRVSRLQAKKRVLLKNITDLFRFSEIDASSYAQVAESLEGNASAARLSFEALFGRKMHHPALVAMYDLVMRKKNAVCIEGDGSHLTLGFKAVLSEFGDNSAARPDDYEYLNFLSSELCRRLRNVALHHNIFLPTNSCVGGRKQALLGSFSQFIARHFPVSLIGRDASYLFSKPRETAGDRVFYLPVLVHNIQFDNDVIGACRLARGEIRLVFASLAEAARRVQFGLEFLRQALREHEEELARRPWAELRGRGKTLHLEAYHLLHNCQELELSPGDNVFELRFLTALPEDAAPLLSADCFRGDKFDSCSYACAEQFFAEGALPGGLEPLLRALGVDSEEDLERLFRLPQVRLQRERSSRLKALLEQAEPLLARLIDRAPCGAHLAQLLERQRLGPLAILTPEFGEFIKRGGLGVIVDDMAKELVELGEEVHVFMPYFNCEKNVKVYEAAGFQRVSELRFPARDNFYVLEVFSLSRGNLHVHLLKYGSFWEDVYVTHNNLHCLKQVGVFCRAALTLMIDRKLKPAVVLTNDWFAGLAAAYKKIRLFGGYFDESVFFHIVHNLGSDYQGKIYLDWSESGEYFASTVELPCEFLFDQHSNSKVINPSHCALYCSDQWGTVSKSYRGELIETSEMKYLLQRYADPFAYPNGVRGCDMQAKFARLPDHPAQKRLTLQRFFGVDLSEAELRQHALYGFIGRICEQKGVMLILEIVEEMLVSTGFRAFFVIAGAIDNSKYSCDCARKLLELKQLYPRNVWGDPHAFFNDGPALTRAADYVLMPSAFEPGGIVQHEAFFASTPVVAYKTGGLKDAVRCFDRASGEGNGLLFEHFTRRDFLQTVKRAHALFLDAPAYARMRENVHKSYIDIKDVARAWRGEFYRLSKRPSVALNQLAIVQPTRPSKTVSLADPYAAHFYVCMRTSSDTWQTEHPLKFNSSSNRWETDAAVADFEEYKLFIDGTPWVDVSQPSLVTGEGFTNNVFFQPAASSA